MKTIKLFFEGEGQEACVGGPVQFRPVLFKGQLYYVSDSNLEFVNAVR